MKENPFYNPQPGKEYDLLKEILEGAREEGRREREKFFGTAPESEEGVIDLKKGEGYTVLPNEAQTPSTSKKSRETKHGCLSWFRRR